MDTVIMKNFGRENSSSLYKLNDGLLYGLRLPLISYGLVRIGLSGDISGTTDVQHDVE